MNLGQFIDTFKDAIAQRVVESYPPLYRPSENGGTLPPPAQKAPGAQADAIRGAALSLEAHRGTTVVGEMGTGKTFIAAAAHLAGFKRVLVLCPPHLVPKWKREVEMTVPGARAVIVKSITDLERLRLSVGSGPLFAVMSREKAKLSYRWVPAVIQRWAVSRGRLLRDEETGEPFRVPCCPDCTAQIVDKDGVPLTDEDLNRRKHTCAGCGSPLWQVAWAAGRSPNYGATTDGEESVDQDARSCFRWPYRIAILASRASVGSQRPQPQLEDSTTYLPLRAPSVHAVAGSTAATSNRRGLGCRA